MTLLGALGGAVVGLAVTLAIVVAKARAGYYTFSLEDLVALRWDTVPVILGTLSGAFLGWTDPRTLDRATLRGFAALIPGLVIGALAGWLLWGAGPGTWAGAIIGSAVGLVAGGTSALRRFSRDPDPLRAGLAGAVALLATGALGVLGVTGARDLAPPEFADVEAAELPPAEAVDAVVFLVGDAGLANYDRHPLLHALRSDIERWSAALARDSATSVIFLGDIVYPSGVREPTHPGFSTDTARLWDQIRLVGGEHATRHGTIGLFTTGNHDWGNTVGDLGIERVVNLEAQLDSARRAGFRVSLLPEPGDPGPAIRDLRNNVRLLFLDTHWFLQQRSEGEKALFFARLASALEGAGDREVILVAHHPFRSAGPHGVTIPGYHAGGVEYLLKQSGTLVQDLNSPVYSEFLAGLRRTFASLARPPLAFAGGHDHSLQVFEVDSASSPRFSLVSGSGSKVSAIRDAPDLAWAAARPGYMMLVFRRDDGVDLFAVAGEPDYRECAGEGPPVLACLMAGMNAFDVLYSATLLGPSGRTVEIPRADDDSAATGTPWWQPAPAPESSADAASPPAVSGHVLSGTDDSVLALPGRTYPAGRLRRMLVGDLNRHLWQVPVKLPVLDLDGVGGGLEPVELTGGMQTVGLRLRGRDGMQYEFRPIVKNPRRVLPDWMREGVIGDLIDDQMAAQFPFGALVVNELHAAAGMAAPALRAVVMPDEERLGEFRERFAGRIGLFGMHVDERGADRPGFAGFTRIVDTESLLDELEREPQASIDDELYLRLRLIDMLVGDWDRHPGQWRWARRDTGRTESWMAIPEDRDWAFPRLDGIANSVTRLFLPRYVGFTDEFPDVSRLAEAALALDTLILKQMTRANFTGAALELQRALADSVIATAVRALPPEIDAVEGNRLESSLRARRDSLVSLARDYHDWLARRIPGNR